MFDLVPLRRSGLELRIYGGGVQVTVTHGCRQSNRFSAFYSGVEESVSYCAFPSKHAVVVNQKMKLCRTVPKILGRVFHWLM